MTWAYPGVDQSVQLPEYVGLNNNRMLALAHEIKTIDAYQTGTLVHNVQHPLYGAVGDGLRDDTSALQAAVDAANSGGIVVIPPGTYVLSAKIDGVSGVSIVGAGNSSIIDATALDLGSQLGAFNFQAKDDVRIAWLQINSGTGSTNGLSFHGCNRVVVHNCTFVGNSSNTNNVASIGVYDDGGAGAGSCEDFKVLANRFVPSNIAVLVQGRASGPFSITDVVVHENTIDGSQSNATAGATGSIKLDVYVSCAVVSGNVIDGASVISDGINVQENVDNISVMGNVVENCARNGIIAEDGQTGGYVRELVIANNVVTDVSGSGDQRGVNLSIVNGGSMRNVLVKGNVIRNVVGEGIAENSGGVTGLVMDGNVIDEFDSAVADLHGILVRGTNVLVQGNRITHSTTGSAGNPRSLRVAAGGTALLYHNQFLANDESSAVTINGSATYRANQGLVTEANGTATLANGTTTVAVTHGLGITPTIADISVNPIEAWGSAGSFWAHTPTATQFTIEVNADPGQDVDFAWSANIQ